MEEDSEYVTLFTVTETAHAGWNYYKWEDSAEYPKYRYYRFHSTNQGGCKINEITFVGVETMDNEDEDYTCGAKVVSNGVEEDLNDVEYKSDLTTFLESISPRYGKVTGGTEVTFTG